MNKKIVMIAILMVSIMSVSSMAITDDSDAAVTFTGNIDYTDGKITLSADTLGSMSGLSSVITADMKANATCVEIINFNNIEDKAFQNFTKLEVAILHDVQIIGSNAFDGCKKLTTVDGENVKTILNNSFQNCEAIRKVMDVGGEGIVSLPVCETAGTYTFYRCYSLEEIHLPNISTASDNFLRECTSLKTCVMEKLSYVPSYMFYLDASLEKVILPSATTLNPSVSFGSSKVLNHVDLRSLSGTIPNSSFNSNNGILRVYSYDSEESVKGDLVIGTVGSSSTVKELPSSMLSNCKGLTFVNLPDVTVVGDSCFSGCISLKNATFNNIGCLFKYQAFDGCSILQSVVAKVTSLDPSTSGTGNHFRNCTSLTTVGLIPGKVDLLGVDGIYNGTFQNCKSITEVRAGSDGTTMYIGTDAFNQSGITTFTTSGSVTFAKSAEALSTGSFYRCYMLEEFTCNRIVGGLGNNLFNSDAKLDFNINGFSDVTSVGTSTFSNSGLSGDIIMEGLSYVNTYAFTNCKITSITLGSKDPSVNAQICYQAFYNCYNLKTVNFISNVEFVGLPSSSLDYLPNTYSFANCVSLETVTFKEGSKFIGDLGGYSFSGCNKLVSISSGTDQSSVFSMVTGLGTNCFYNCDKLGVGVEQYSFDNVIVIDSNAFTNTNGIKNAVFEKEVKLNYRAFYLTSFKTLDFRSGIDVRDDRNTVPTYDTFRESNSLTTVIIGGTGLDKVYDQMFYGCKALKDVGPSGTSGITLPSVKSIGAYAFYNCNLINKISCGTLESIGTRAFYGCTSMTTINPTDGYDVVISTAVIPEYAFYNCTSIRSVFSETKVTEVGGYAFVSCKLMKTFTDTEGKTGLYLFNVKTIGDYSFQGCQGLDMVNMGGSLTTIGKYAFQNCYFLKDLYLSYSLSSIGECAFYNCYSLKSLVLPQNLSTIGKQAFIYCTGLTDVVIPNNVTTIGEQAFFATTNGGTGTLYICTDSGTSYGSNFIKFTGTREWTVYSTAPDGTKISPNMNIDKCSYLKRDLITVTLNGDFGIYNSPKMVIMDGCKVLLPYAISGSEIVSKDFGIAVNSSSNGLLVGKSGDMVTLYSGPSGDYTLFTTGKYSDTISISMSRGELKDIRFELNNVSYKGELSLTDLRYGDMITMPMAYLAGYDFNRYTGAITKDSLSLKPGSEVRLTFFETSFEVGSVPRLFTLTLSVDGEDTKLDVLSGASVENAISEIRLNPTLAGYEFDEWLESPGNLSSKIGKGYTMPAHDLILYAGFVPSEFKITISSDVGLFTNIEIDVEGPFSITLDSYGRLLVTDTGTMTNSPQVNPNSLVKGKEFRYYSVTSPNTQGVSFDDAGSLKAVDGRTSNLDIRLILSDSVYSISFDYGGLIPTVPATFTKESPGEDLIWSDILGGVVVSVPVVDGWVLSGVSVGPSKLEVTDGTVTLNQDHFAISDDVIISFSFEQGRYIVKFNYNDDAGHTSQRTGTVKEGDGSKISFGVSPYTKQGYTFSGWRSGGFEYTSLQISKNPIVDFTKDVMESIGEVEDMTIVFEAQWEPNTYDIKMELNVGVIEGEVPEVVWIMGEPLSGLVDPVRKGYVFVGWALMERTTGADSTIFVFNGDVLTRDILSQFSDGAVIFIEAVWSNGEYTMVFDNNGASGGSNISPIVKVFGDTFKLPDHNTNSKANHTYGGWVIVGDSRTFNDGDEVTIDEALADIGDRNGGNVTFKMNWVSTDYYISYNLNGGHGVTIANSGPYNIGDVFMPESPSGLVRSGYSFAGWALTADAVVSYSFGGDFDTNMAFYAESSTSKTATLYAVWSQLQYNIQYDLQSGVSGNQSPVKAFYGKVVTISNPSKVGYRFAGWTATGLTADAQYVSGDGFVVWNDGSVAADSTEFKNLSYIQNGTVVLTANWAKATYRIQYDLNGGAGTISGGTTTASIGDSFSFPSYQGQMLNGHEFSGWSTDGASVLRENKFTAAMAVRADENGVVTLKAVWTPISYNVEFRFTETDTFTSTKAYFGVSLQLSKPERHGYTFAGWKSTDVSSQSIYSPDGTVWYSWPSGGQSAEGCFFMNLTDKKDATVHLTAVWIPMEYRVVYSANGGAGNPPVDNNTYKIGDKFTLASVKDIEGTYGNKIMLGWSTDRMATVPMVVDEFYDGLAEKANSANIVTMYAVWIEGSYTVTVDIGESKPSMVPAGWEADGPGKYKRTADYGSSVKDILSDWDMVVLEYPDHVFTSWSYNLGTVLTNITVTAQFDSISKDMLYVFVGAVALIGIVAFAITRFERW